MKLLSVAAGYMTRMPRPYYVAGALTCVLAFAGCDGKSQSSAVDGTVAASKAATVNLSIGFPADDAAGKAIIPTYAQWVGFRYCRIPQNDNWCYYDEGAPGSGKVQLTRESPSTVLTLIPGNYMFEAGSFLSTDESGMIDYAQTAGEIVEGSNTIRLTFIQGDWTFKSNTDANDPITLGDGTVFSGFKLYASRGGTHPVAAAGKAGFNPSLAAGWMWYGAKLKTSAGEKSGSGVTLASQFHSGDESHVAMMGMRYNLTKDCSEEQYYRASSYYCEGSEGDWRIDMIGNGIEGHENHGPYGLLPDPELKDEDGNPIDGSSLNSRPTDGVTIMADIADYQIGTTSVELIEATAAKAVAAVVTQNQGTGLRAAIAHAVAAGNASKSVNTTNIGTLIDTWYEPVIAASGDGSERGTWEFGTYVWDEQTQDWVWDDEGCLAVTSEGRVYAHCGYLGGGAQAEIGEFSWGLSPADPNDLGEYDCQHAAAGYYEPWCFWDKNGDGSIDYGSFQFTHYMQESMTLHNVRIHRVMAKGVELPQDTSEIVVE